MQGRLLRLALLTLLGTFLGGGLSAVRAAQHYPTYEATLQMRVLTDPVVGDEGAAADTSVEAFVNAELVTLNSLELPRAGAGQRTSTVATAVSGTNIVEVRASASTAQAAVAAADLARQTYVQRRRGLLQQRISVAQTQVDQQLRATSTALDASNGSTGITVSVQRQALTAEYTRLIALRNTLQLASDASSRLVQVVKAAAVGGARQVVSPVRSAVLGGVVGAVLGLSGALLLARWRRRLSGLDDLLALAPDVALPTMPHLGGRDLARRAGAAASQYVSALSGQDGRFAQPALVVVAPNRGAGSTVVAVGIAVASARRGPTVLLSAGSALDSYAAELLGLDPRFLETQPPATPLETAFEGLTYVVAVEGRGPLALATLERRIADGLLPSLARDGTSVVIDAPALSRSSAGLDLARQCGQALLVGGLERTTAAELDVAAAALRRVGARLVGVVLDTPDHGPRRGSHS